MRRYLTYTGQWRHHSLLRRATDALKHRAAVAEEVLVFRRDRPKILRY